MIKPASLLELARKPIVLLGVAALLVAVVVWLFVFFEPQTHKLGSLQSQKASLQETLVQDRTRLGQLRRESHHVGQIQTIDAKLKGYVPASEDLYTYIESLSSAGNKAGITISSLQPSAMVAASGTSYSAIPITAEVKGTYDHVVAFLGGIYNLKRLTDINTVTITGGGPNTNRSTVLSVTLDLVIFTSQKASTTS